MDLISCEGFQNLNVTSKNKQNQSWWCRTPAWEERKPHNTDCVLGFFFLHWLSWKQENKAEMERRKMSVLRRGIGDEKNSLSVVVQIPFFLHLPTNLNSKGKLFILLSKIVWFRCLNHRLHLLIVSYRSGGLKPNHNPLGWCKSPGCSDGAAAKWWGTLFAHGVESSHIKMAKSHQKKREQLPYCLCLYC